MSNIPKSCDNFTFNLWQVYPQKAFLCQFILPNSLQNYTKFATKFFEHGFDPPPFEQCSKKQTIWSCGTSLTDSIPWVLCASGNVLVLFGSLCFFVVLFGTCWYFLVLFGTFWFFWVQNPEMLSKSWNLVKILFVKNPEIWSKSWNLVKILKFGWNPEIWSKIRKFAWNSEIWSKCWNLVKILKFGQHPEIWSKSWNLATRRSHLHRFQNVAPRWRQLH